MKPFINLSAWGLFWVVGASITFGGMLDALVAAEILLAAVKAAVAAGLWTLAEMDAARFREGSRQ